MLLSFLFLYSFLSLSIFIWPYLTVTTVLLSLLCNISRRSLPLSLVTAVVLLFAIATKEHRRRLRIFFFFSSPRKMEANASPFKVILGSSSVARRKILAEMGYEFSVMSADIDEKQIRKDKPEELVMVLAEAKADAIMLKIQSDDKQEKEDVRPNLLVAADTVVVYEGMIREKPSNKEEAREFIKGYSGAHAATVSSVIVTNLNSGSRKGGWDKVEIYFHEIPDQVIDDLINEGRVLHVAGALIIEHPLILPYVKQLVGTTDSVMGLPKSLTEKLIKEAL